MTRFPNSVEDLLDDLERQFPEPRIAPGMSADRIQYDAGQRSVVLFLRELRQRSLQGSAASPTRGVGRPQ